MGRGRWLLLALAAACLAAYPMPALGGAHHGCFFEEHMQQMLGLEDHTDLHAHIHEASRKAQAQAEAVAASGSGTSHYLKWRLSQLPDSDTYSDINSDSDIGSGRHGFVSLERGRALEVMSGSVNSTALQPPGLNSAPGPADINIIPPRHGSAVAPGVVDWRASPAVSTNITDQMSHVCDCGFKKCCSGGWPEWTFQFAQLNKGVAPLSSYPYLAKDSQKCATVNASLLTGKITGWEKHPAADPALLMKTVSMHPVMVLIRASASFLSYRGGIFRGTDCAKRVSVNHALVLMGFNASGPDPYWIAKNSWGTGWGEGGYIRISMLTTVCGFGSEPSMYPTMFRVKTPCDAVPSPCGKGTCYLMGDGTARCTCPSGFVEKIESSVPKCATASPCASPINPCAIGVCSNEFDGTYTCRCPSGTVVGSRADGGETCVVNSFQSGLVTTTALAGDNCSTLAITYNLTSAQVFTMNPFLNCSGPITPGTLVVVGGALSGVGCGARDAVTPDDTCSSFAAKNGITVSQLLTLNPSTNCAFLPVSAHLCVMPGRLDLSSPYEPSCGVSYDTEIGDTCLSVAQEYNSSIVIFEWLNPAIDCTQPLPLTTVCTSPLMLGTAAVTCSAYYNVTQADTCFSVASAAGMQLSGFLALNPGLRCYWPNWVVGLTVCIQGVATSLGDMELQPNLIPYYIRKNDTLAAIANSFAGQCNDPDGAIVDVPSLMTAICWANGWLPAECSDRWIVIGSMILVPCAKDIGATTCSAALSTTSVSTATALSYCCGNNGVTYISYYCASSSYAIPTSVDGGGCPACGTLCTGIAGRSISSTYGGTLPGCMASQACTFPQAPTASQASQMCVANATVGASATSQYARYLCSMATRSLSKIDNTNPKLSTACVNFKTCLMEAMGYKKALTSTTYGVDTSLCPYTTRLNCGAGGASIAYDLSFCQI